MHRWDGKEVGRNPTPPDQKEVWFSDDVRTTGSEEGQWARCPIGDGLFYFDAPGRPSSFSQARPIWAVADHNGEPDLVGKESGGGFGVIGSHTDSLDTKPPERVAFLMPRGEVLREHSGLQNR